MKRWIMILCSWLGMVYTTEAQISEGMKRLIKAFEGLSTEVYMDGEHLAVGYGHHIRNNTLDWVQDLVPGEEITVELAELLFDYDMNNLVNSGLMNVRKDIGWNYPDNVYDVMGSLIYNIGLEGLKKSDFYRSFKNREYEKAFTELLMLKSKEPGIRLRRQEELRILLQHYHPIKKSYILPTK